MSLDYHIAQLRHAYRHLLAGRPTEGNYDEFANGLIAPAIRYLERLRGPPEPDARNPPGEQ